ncbi:relaxase/mobilization nuclease domain-containing protein [Paratractidigestivibacter sp.]|uniref:relaxase/mobilization nuclease domain-containing protein n=1 Tax=Paratractidigestivibacter sp. TaxID=2847316 RepID=UPI002AC8BB20|nr:relaxase/mobilization nuclease domain-containing protein [Paratractidigestivibacter sp.]
MTVIKQKSVCSRQHLASIKKYLNWDREKALAHDTLNITEEGRWFEEMDATREAYGHNAPGKAGARCTYMQHQVLGFNPDECDLNGGKMTPEGCMAFAHDYVAERYPDQEVVMVLHKEHCRADGTDRYAVHLGINRTDLGTGLRLDEGPARKAGTARAKTVRSLDERYGLAQLERGKANSRVHARQPSRAEKETAARNRVSKTENQRVRETVARRVEEVSRMPRCDDRLAELRRRLGDDRIRLDKGARGGLQYRYRSESLGQERRISGARLGFAVNRSSGRVIRFTLRGIGEAMRAFYELEREAMDNSRER